MLNSKGFYTFPGQGGTRFVNINNIAHIESVSAGCKITLNVKNEKGEFIIFVATLPFGYVTGQIVHMDNYQNDE